MENVGYLKKRGRLMFLYLWVGLYLLAGCNQAAIDNDNSNSPVVLSGTVSYPSANSSSPQSSSRIKGLTTPSTDSASVLTEADLADQGVKEASVELYAVDDDDFTKPLTKAISTDGKGKYNFTRKDFKNEENTKKNAFIARAIFVSPKSKAKIMLKALVDSSNTNTDINPLTFTLMEKIKQVFTDLGLTLNEDHWLILKDGINTIVSQTKTEGIKFDPSAEIKVTDAGKIDESAENQASLDALTENINTGTEGLFTQLGEEIIAKKDEIEQKTGQKIKGEKDQMTRSLLSFGFSVETDEKDGLQVYLPPEERTEEKSTIPGKNTLGEKNKNFRTIGLDDVKEKQEGKMDDLTRSALKDKMDDTRVITKEVMDRLMENKDKTVTFKEVLQVIVNRFIWGSKIFKYDADGNPIFSDQTLDLSTEVSETDLWTEIKNSLPEKPENTDKLIAEANHYLFKVAARVIRDNVKEDSREELLEKIRKSAAFLAEKERIKHLYFSGLGRFFGMDLTEDTRLYLREAMVFFALLTDRPYLINVEAGWVMEVPESPEKYQVNFANIKYLITKEKNVNRIFIEDLLGLSGEDTNEEIEEDKSFGNELEEEILKNEPKPDLTHNPDGEEETHKLVLEKLSDAFMNSFLKEGKADDEMATGMEEGTSSSPGESDVLSVEEDSAGTETPRRWLRDMDLTGRSTSIEFNTDKTEATISVINNHAGNLYVDDTNNQTIDPWKKAIKDETGHKIVFKKNSLKNWVLAAATAVDISAIEPDRTFTIGKVRVSREGKPDWEYASESDLINVPDGLLVLLPEEEVLVEVDLSGSEQDKAFFAFLHHDGRRDPLFDDESHGDKKSGDRIFSRKYKIGKGHVGRHHATVDVINAETFKDETTAYDSHAWRLPYLVGVRAFEKPASLPEKDKVETDVAPEVKAEVVLPNPFPKDDKLILSIGEVKLDMAGNDQIEKIEVEKNTVKFNGVISTPDACHSIAAWHTGKIGEIRIIVRPYRTKTGACAEVITPYAFEGKLMDIPLGKYNLKFFFGKELIKEEEIKISKPETHLTRPK